MSAANRIRRQRGFSILEVLVALLVLAIGLLGLAALQAQGLQFNQDAYLRSQATVIAYDFSDRMRANRGTAYPVGDLNYPPGTPCTETPPAGGVVQNDLNCFIEALGLALPGASATIAQDAVDNRYYRITVRWQDREGKEGAGGDVGANQAECEATVGREWYTGGGPGVCTVAQTWTVFP